MWGFVFNMLSLKCLKVRKKVEEIYTNFLKKFLH